MTTTISRSSAIGLVAAAVAAPQRAWAQASTVRVGASLAATQAEMYYAEQLGMFKQAGITTILTTVTRSAETLSYVVRGDIDVGGTSPQAIANAIIHGFSVRIIAAAAVYAGNPPPVQLFVAKNSPLRDARSFETVTVAVQTLNDSQSLGVLVWLRQHRVDTTKIKFVEMPFSTMGAALERGEVNAACILEPFASAHKDAIRAVPQVYDGLGRHWALTAWYARSDWADKNSRLVKQFTGALYATARRVNADPASIDELLSTYSKVPIDSVRITPKPIWSETLERSSFEPQMQAAAEFKLIPHAITYREMIG